MATQKLTTLTTEQYTAYLLMRQAPGMVGLLDDPYQHGNTITGLCAPDDETPWRYEIDVRTARLNRLEEVK